jgi:EAL domain-containing protein (putative c-di-GMP-specific phosphodiesterase class I)
MRLHALKIDRSFVNSVPAEPDDTAVIEAIIAMGKSLGMRLIAEGVETLEQLDFLRSRNCDEMQGYLLSKPQPAEVIVDILRKEQGAVGLGRELCGKLAGRTP